MGARISSFDAVLLVDDARAMNTLVSRFPGLHLLVTGNRRTPLPESAHRSFVPLVRARWRGAHPLSERMETTRVTEFGLSDDESQHSSGAGRRADQVADVPLHDSPRSSRRTVPEESIHTRIVVTCCCSGWVLALAALIHPLPPANSAIESASALNLPGRCFLKNSTERSIPKVCQIFDCNSGDSTALT